MIVIDNLQWEYKDFKVTIDSLTLPLGISLLAGSNGAGKSTFLHLLATAKLTDSGAIYYDDRCISEQLLEIRSQIGFVPTGIELYQDFTPIKLLNYFAQLKGLPNSFAKMQISKLLKVFRLEDVSKKKIKKLSQGMQQRLALAQSLLGKPKYILLDEPLNFLDIHERKAFLQYLVEISMQSVVVVATHELNEWEHISRNVLWLADGKVQFFGSKLNWKTDLDQSVWCGVVPSKYTDDFFKNHNVIYASRREDGVFVKCISNNPIDGFTKLDTTMEDAFFIRKASLENV
ncbi:MULTISPECIES: ATP-binding cassette domain-containing protein [Bacillus]|uniref:ATP-binding cassette domain-containing protein n=1 Tax=Bacillus TaxID=1386 RepID=UPI000BB6EED4|nr:MULTISPECIES: ATP-binding cassette domain-containing protein [Bacillus]